MTPNGDGPHYESDLEVFLGFYRRQGIELVIERDDGAVPPEQFVALHGEEHAKFGTDPYPFSLAWFDMAGKFQRQEFIR